MFRPSPHSLHYVKYHLVHPLLRSLRLMSRFRLLSWRSEATRKSELRSNQRHRNQTFVSKRTERRKYARNKGLQEIKPEFITHQFRSEQTSVLQRPTLIRARGEANRWNDGLRQCVVDVGNVERRCQKPVHNVMRNKSHTRHCSVTLTKCVPLCSMSSDILQL